MDNTRKRKCLSVKDKIDLLKKFSEEKMPVASIMKFYGIGKTQVYDIIKNKQKYLDHSAENLDESRKRLKVHSPYEELNIQVFDWFCSVRAKNVPISGPLICEKALDIASKMDIKDFKASNGWLERWKKYHGVNAHRICGEENSVDKDIVTKFKNTVSDKCSDYDMKDVFNADETGLFYRALPDKTLDFKGLKCRGGKLAKQRLTVLVT